MSINYPELINSDKMSNVVLNPLTTYYRYVGQAEYERIIKDGMAPDYSYSYCFVGSGKEGELNQYLWFTTNFYPNSQVAKSMLALPNAPLYRIRFNLAENTFISGEIGITNKHEDSHGVWGAGGGEEYKLTNKVIKAKCWIEKLPAIEHDSLIYIFRLKELINNPIRYQTNYEEIKKKIDELNLFLYEYLDKEITDFTPDKENWYRTIMERLRTASSFDALNPFVAKKWISESYFFFLAGLKYKTAKNVVYQIKNTPRSSATAGYLSILESYYKECCRALISENKEITEQLLNIRIR